MGAVPNTFMLNVLAQIRAPQTAVNVQNLQTWQRYEGGSYVNNPLNIEEDGAVVDFPTAAVGELTTANTIRNGRYTAILTKLRQSAPLALWNEPTVLEQIDVWGTTDFAAYISTLIPEVDDLTPLQAQQLQEIWDALFSAAPPNGAAPWNNLEIIRRQETILGAPYDLDPGPVPPPK